MAEILSEQVNLKCGGVCEMTGERQKCLKCLHDIYHKFLLRDKISKFRGSYKKNELHDVKADKKLIEH